jgi:regulator of RNase E activity RraA
MSALDRLRAAGTGAVSDALDLLGIDGGLLGLARRSGTGTIAGPAWTLQFRPVADGEPGPAADFIDDVPAGAVVMVANGGRDYCTVWGDILTDVAQRRGLAGTVIDGCCRDLGEIRSSGYPLWSRGVYMKSGKNRVRLSALQVPVEIAGTVVGPGDVVCADDAGVLVVPADRLEQVMDQVDRVTGMEAEVRAAVAEGVPLREARRRHGYNLAAVHTCTG